MTCDTFVATTWFQAGPPGENLVRPSLDSASPALEMAKEVGCDRDPTPVVDPCRKTMTTSLSFSSVPLCSESLGLCIYTGASPEHSLAFIDGCPLTLADLDHLRLTLIRACATVAAGGAASPEWDTALGVVEVRRGAFTVLVNGESLAPATVVRYADEIGRLMDRSGHFDA